jgi:hypothetical protein
MPKQYAINRVLDACDIEAFATQDGELTYYCLNVDGFGHRSNIADAPPSGTLFSRDKRLFFCNRCGFDGALNALVCRAMQLDDEAADWFIVHHGVRSPDPCEHPCRPDWAAIRHDPRRLEARFFSFREPPASRLDVDLLDSVRAVDIRYDHGQFVFGVRNANGSLLAYYRTRLDELGQLMRLGRILPSWNRAQAMLFGLDHVEIDSEDPVVVVDNPWDVVRFDDIDHCAVWPINLRPAELDALAPLEGRLVVTFDPRFWGPKQAARFADRFPAARYANYHAIEKPKTVVQMKRSERRAVIRNAVDASEARHRRLIEPQ